MLQPTNKYFMQDYRRVLGTGDAPQMIDTENPVVPVAIINDGFIRASENQRVRWGYVAITAVGTYQIATASANLKVYFLGAYITATSLTINGVEIFDGTTGTAPSPAVNTLVTDQSASFVRFVTNAVGYVSDKVPLFPVQMQRGIRLDCQSAAVDGRIVVFWLEETVN